MDFRNVKVPEGINVSRHSPLADFFLLSGGIVACFVALAAALLFFGSALARHTPVSWETALASALFDGQGATVDSRSAEIAGELQALADRLAAHIDLPEGLAVTVHYLDEDQVNAFATLGGHVFIARGLLERTQNENALAMVMAHEIAHVAHRDPAASLGGVVLLQLLLAVILDSAPAALEQLVSGPNALLLRGFSRETERQADTAALGAVAALYGHVAEAGRIFEVFLEQPEPPELLSTHPLSRDRIDAIVALAHAEGWALEGPRTPLAPALAKPSADPR